MYFCTEIKDNRLLKNTIKPILKNIKKFSMRSDEVKKGYQRAPHRSLFRATGLIDEDFDKPYANAKRY